MTVAEFRRLALALPGAVESAHMGHPDFRVNNRIFATLGYPDRGWAMVKLTPEQQTRLVKRDPKAFAAVKGAWGLQGATNLRLDAADASIVRELLESAAKNVGTRQRKRR